MVVLRPWGSYEVIGNGPNYQVKQLRVKPGQRLSLQSHRFRSEHWTVVAGGGEAEVDSKKHVITVGDHLFIPTGAKHRLTNPDTTLLVIVEVQCGPRIDEEDIIRYADDYGRAA